jgi:hypothetical protein
MASEHQPQTTLVNQRREKHRTHLIYQMLAGPVIWSLYFIVGYEYTEVACSIPHTGFPVWLYMASTQVIVVLTLLATLAIAGAGWLSWRRWRQFQNDSHATAQLDDHDVPDRFLAQAGILLSVLFVLLTLLTGTAALFLEIC